MFEYEALQIVDNQQVAYKGVRARGVIFCEGARAQAHNPYFGRLPFWCTKGEVLLVHLPEYELGERIMKHKGVLLAPMQQAGLFWLGSTYERDAADLQPTEQARAYLLEQLQAGWRLGRVEVLEHLSAVRPTVRDRRPYLGCHPVHRNIFIFNGLGAKGTYLAPYFAPSIAAFVLRGEPLPKEVNILRLGKKVQW